MDIDEVKGIAQVYMSMQEKKKDDEEFKPHMMYDPKTGKGYKANKPEDHERMKKMGYTHDDPKTKAKEEDASNDKSDDGEGMDKVDKKALKMKFKDRKDKDIDNDGDTDDSDEYLHKKRQAVSKAINDDKRQFVAAAKAAASDPVELITGEEELEEATGLGLAGRKARLGRWRRRGRRGRRGRRCVWRRQRRRRRRRRGRRGGRRGVVR